MLLKVLVYVILRCNQRNNTLDCVLKRIVPVRQWAESNLIVLYFTFFFFQGVGQKFVCTQVEDRFSFNTEDESNIKRK